MNFKIMLKLFFKKIIAINYYGSQKKRKIIYDEVKEMTLSLFQTIFPVQVGTSREKPRQIKD